MRTGAAAPPATSVRAHYRHVGLYAYRAEFLHRFASLAPAPSELAESLEQLRAIHHGYSIHVEAARERSGPGVDTPADLERVRAIFSRSAAEGSTVPEAYTNAGKDRHRRP